MTMAMRPRACLSAATGLGHEDTTRFVELHDQYIAAGADPEAAAKSAAADLVAEIHAEAADLGKLIGSSTEPERQATRQATAGAPAESEWDFETTFPQPQTDALNQAGRDSMFVDAGIDEEGNPDPAALQEAIKGVFNETGFGIQSDAADTRALLDGLKTGTDPATGKPAKPARLQKMRSEVATNLDNIQGSLDEIANEFGQKAADAFAEVVVPELDALSEEFDQLRESKLDAITAGALPDVFVGSGDRVPHPPAIKIGDKALAPSGDVVTIKSLGKDGLYEGAFIGPNGREHTKIGRVTDLKPAPAEAPATDVVGAEGRWLASGVVERRAMLTKAGLADLAEKKNIGSWGWANLSGRARTALNKAFPDRAVPDEQQGDKRRPVFDKTGMQLNVTPEQMGRLLADDPPSRWAMADRARRQEMLLATGMPQSIVSTFDGLTWDLLSPSTRAGMYAAAGLPQPKQAPRGPTPQVPTDSLGVRAAAMAERSKNAKTAEKLRATAQSTIDAGEAKLHQDRSTNTARRARMADGAEADARASIFIGKKMLALADAIEAGDAPALVGITSRLGVEQLQQIKRSAMGEADRSAKLSYREEEQRKGRAWEPRDAAYIRYPTTSWNSGELQSLTEALKGKKGGQALAKTISRSPPTGEILSEAKRILGEATAKRVLGPWIADRVAGITRLQKAGIENVEQLKAAIEQYNALPAEGAKVDRVKQLERALVGIGKGGVGIDFFPTPPAVAQRMVGNADISAGMRVLEPSAGNGNIADAIRNVGVEPDVVEVSDRLREILEAKGHNLVGRDFMDYDPGEVYDRIVMNPPFGKGAAAEDITHVQHAFAMLKPGGRLVAIMGEGTFHRNEKKAVAFRAWLEQQGAEEEKLESGTFADKQQLATTGAASRIVTIDKQPSVAEERGVYEINEPTENRDLFDFSPTPAPAPKKQIQATLDDNLRRGLGKLEAERAKRGQRQIAPTQVLAVRPDEAMPGMYRVSSQLVTVGDRELPVSKVDDWQSAVTALGALHRFAVEHFDVLITDASGKPLAVIGSFKGAHAATTVYPGTLLAEAMRIKGAANAWAVHNHPSGSEILSAADLFLSETMAKTFEPSRVKWQGIAAIGGGSMRWNAVDQHRGNLSGDVAVTTEAGTTVPIVERVLYGQAQVNQTQVMSPAQAKTLTTMMANGEPGLLFLNTQNQPTAWVPMTADEAHSMRVDHRFDRLVNAAANAGAGGAIVADPNSAFGERALQNIVHTLARLDLRLLDVIDTVQMISMTERGTMPPYTVGPVLSIGSSERPRVEMNGKPAAEHVALVADLAERLNTLGANGGPLYGKPVEMKAVASDENTDPEKAYELTAVSAIARRLFGHEVVPVEFGKGSTALFGGAMVPDIPGKVFLNVNANLPLMAVLGHELLHQLRAGAPILYRDLQTRLDAVIQNDEVFKARLAALRARAGRELPDNWREELHADIVGDRFLEPEFWKLLATAKKPGLFRQIVDAILRFLDGVAKKIGAQHGFGTAQFLSDIAAARAAVVDAMVGFNAKSFTSEKADVLMAEQGRQEPFYSAFAEAVGKVSMKKGDAQAWMHFIKGLVAAGKVKQAEVDWSGVEEWLKLQTGNADPFLRDLIAEGRMLSPTQRKQIAANPGIAGDKITREQVQKFLADNGVRVTERAFGGSTSESLARQEQARLTVEYDNWLRENGMAPMSADELARSMREALELYTEEDEKNPAMAPGLATMRERIAYLEDFVERWDAATVGDEDMRGADDTTYAQYTLPGGENYRELLLTLPQAPGSQLALREAIFDKWQPLLDAARMKADSLVGRADSRSYNEAVGEIGRLIDQRDDEAARVAGEIREFHSTHWQGTKNVLAHIRMNERTDADGKRVLFIEEIQSDWAQQGKKKGFGATMGKAYSVFNEHGQHMVTRTTRELAQRAIDEQHGRRIAGNASGPADTSKWTIKEVEVKVKEGPPRAPFVVNTEAWVALALKRAIKIAVDEGFDRVALVNGEQSVDRYSLEKHVSRLRWYDAGTKRQSDFNLDAPEGYGNLMAYDLNGNLVIDKDIDASKLEDYIGKEAARRLLEAPKRHKDMGDGRPPSGHMRERELSGLQLKVGGEGMKAFYDTIVPNVAKEVVRKLGGEGLKKIDVGHRTRAFQGEQEAPGGPPLAVVTHPNGMLTIELGNDAGYWGQWPATAEGRRFAEMRLSKLKVSYSEQAHEQLGFDITPRMKAEAVAGVPLFSEPRLSMIDTLRNRLDPKRDLIAGKTTRPYTPAQTAAMKHVGFQTQSVTMEERAKALWQDAGKKLAQGLVDQFAPIKDISKVAYGLARLAKGASGAFETLLQGGRLKLTQGVYDFDTSKKGGFAKRFLIPLQGEHQDVLRWIAANRAEQLTKEERENLFTAEDIAALKTLADGVTSFDYTIQHGANKGMVTRDRTLIYPDATRTLNEFGRNVLDMAEQSGLIDGESRAIWERDFYVPFYRVGDEGDITGANVKDGLVRQEAFKTLKGGLNKLNADLLDNVLMNWSHLLDASAKNRAAKAAIEAAEQPGIDMATPAKAQGKGTVFFREKGEKRYSLIRDPYFLTAVSSLGYAGMRSPVMNAMSFAKHALTEGVTRSPFFKVRNLIRDSVQSIATSDLGLNPLANVAEGYKLTHRDADSHFQLLASGGTIHFGTLYEGNEAKRMQRLVAAGIDGTTVLDGDNKVKEFYRKVVRPAIDAYDELGNRGEEINRAALYAQLVRQGVGHAEAALQARDLMDFSMQGSFTSIRFLTQTVPFFNARIQGLYKLGRAAKEDPARLALVLGAAAALSIGLLAAYSGDDDWKKREEWDRNNYWWFKFGGVAFRIPKPFEIGAIATLAERSFELAFEKEMTLPRFRSQVLALLGDNLSLNPIPQMVKPILDVYANYDSFTGRPIETAGMERLAPEYRFNEQTSMTARAASTAANAVTGPLGIASPSPVQIDHLLRGYFSWLGSFAVGAGDMIARLAVDKPAAPTPDYWKTATGGMVAEIEGAPSRYLSQLYQQAKAVEQAYGTWHELRQQGKYEEADHFEQAHRDEIAMYRTVERAKRAEGTLNERIRRIRESNASGDEKQQQIRDVQQRRDAIARTVQP